MRIIGGTHRGTTLAIVGKGDEGAHLRPTSDRVRESLFNVLSGGRFGDPVTDVHVLDLFAGTGALGLEALSRGAAHVTLVDDGRVAQRLIRENIAKLRRSAETTLIGANATRLPANTGPRCGLILLDPPYGRSLGSLALRSAQESGWIADDALVLWEESAPQPPPTGFRLLDQRRYGDTHVSFMQPDQPQVG